MKNSFVELKLDELIAKRDELRKKYFDLRFQLVVGHVENPLEKRNLRRHIARVETRITEHRNAGEVASAKGAATSPAPRGRKAKAVKPEAATTVASAKAATTVARGAK
jgi:large subunit ribosomal protein L29